MRIALIDQHMEAHDVASGSYLFLHEIRHDATLWRVKSEPFSRATVKCKKMDHYEKYQFACGNGHFYVHDCKVLVAPSAKTWFARRTVLHACCKKELLTEYENLDFPNVAHLFDGKDTITETSRKMTIWEEELDQKKFQILH